MMSGGHLPVPAAAAPVTPSHHGSRSAAARMVTIDDLRFVDSRHGFTVVTTCQPDGEDCLHTLAATADAGRTWHGSQMPWGPADDASDGPRLFAFDTRHLVLDADAGGHRRWRSADGGATWQPAKEPGTATVAAAPAHSMIVAEDPEYWGGPGGPLFALSPDGSGRWLAHQPADLDDLDGDPVVAHDGGVWVTGGADGTPEWVAVSRDHGRTWHTSTTPALATGACTLLAPSTVAYLGCAGDTRPAVYRSADSGRTWRPTAAPTGWSTLVTAGAVPLCAEDAGTVYALGKRGSFERVDGAPPATALAGAGAYAVLVTGDAAGVSYYLSIDGTAWREITPGT